MRIPCLGLIVAAGAAALVMGSTVSSRAEDPSVGSLEDAILELEAQHPPDPRQYALLLTRARELRRAHAAEPEAGSRVLAATLSLHRIYGRWGEFLAALAQAARDVERPEILGLELLYVPAAVDAEARYAGLGIESVATERLGVALHAMDTLAARFPATETAADALWASYLVLRADPARADPLLGTLAKPPYDQFEAGKRAVVFQWSRAHLSVDAEIPDASWAAADGTKLTTRQLRGTPAVLYFWSSSCAPCKPTIELLRAASERFSGKLAFVGLNYDDAREDFVKGVAAHKPPGRQVHMQSQAEAQRFPAAEFPQVVILNSAGRVHRVLADRGQLEDVLEALTR